MGRDEKKKKQNRINRKKSSSREKTTKKEQNGLNLDLERTNVRRELKEKLEEELEPARDKKFTIILEGAIFLLTGCGSWFVLKDQDIYCYVWLMIICILAGAVVFIKYFHTKKRTERLKKNILIIREKLYWQKEEEKISRFSKPKMNQRLNEQERLRDEADEYLGDIRKCFVLKAILIFVMFGLGGGMGLSVIYAGQLTLEHMRNPISNETVPTEIPEPTVTPKPYDTLYRSEHVTVAPSFSPVPKDEAQEGFDYLWNDYMGSFPVKSYTLDGAKEQARKIIQKTWLHSSFDKTRKNWSIEEMEFYQRDAYKKVVGYENRLRDEDNDAYSYLTGCLYVEATENNIKTGENLEERSLGTACLRGVDLLMSGLRTSKLSIKQKGIAFYNTGLLLRHCADSVYGGQGDKSFVLYVFSSVCYELADENNFENSEMDSMDEAVKNTMPCETM